MRTQAMFATTIAEFYVENDTLRVELEIGLADLPAFANLLPDDIYAKLGNEPRPLAERLETFFGRDLAIFADGGSPLAGRVLEMGPRPRVRRDDITGEPLAANPDEEEIVVVATLAYPFQERPDFLVLRGPAGASLGFVLYHAGIAVNDFRYLTPGATVDLDWGDPFYSRFRNRGMRRQYFAAMSGFLYVEPYEVRKEIILRPRDLEQWIDLGLAGRDTIPAELQPELKRKVAEFLRGHHKVLIDGEAVPGELARINFLERTLRTSRVVDPPRDLDRDAATLGAIFVYPTNGLPESVTMEWDLFGGRIQQVPAASVDQAGPLPVILEPDFHMLEWQNFLKNPELPTLQVLAPPPSAAARALLWLRWILLAATLGLAGAALLRGLWDQRRLQVAVVAVAVLAGASFWFARGASLSDESARTVIAGLLHNVYRAFDYREEEQIYDVLAKSVEGELLAQIYLETRRGLELANQGGARAKVKQIEVVELAATPEADGAFRANAVWNVAGSVGHCGHVHSRSNRYRAELLVSSVDGSWKLTELSILEEERL